MTPRSSVTFSLQRKQRLIIGKLGDISMEGAKVSGPFTFILKEGDVIMPFTMTLSQKEQAAQDVIINASEATVIWLKADDDVTTSGSAVTSWMISQRERC